MGEFATTGVKTEKPSFFFAQEVPYGLAIVRILLPWTMMYDIVDRWPWARELYSADGAPSPLADAFGYTGLLPELPGTLAVGLYSLLPFLLLTTSIGWCSRLSLFGLTLLYGYFSMLDHLSTITKYTVIFGHLTLLLGLSACGQIWSVDAWLKRRTGLSDERALPRFPIWPARLIQLFLGFMYLGAAITKLKTPAFFSGDQLMYWMMTYVNGAHPLGDWLTQFPLLLSLFGYMTILWECTFLVTVFHPSLKWWALAIGAVFHIMTLFTLGLFVFPAVMLASYAAFLTEDEARRLLAWLPWPAADRRSSAVPAAAVAPAAAAATRGFTGWQLACLSWGIFGLTALLVGLGGVWAEHRIDPYGMRASGGMLPLREMDAAEIGPMLEFDAPLRHSDKLLAFELGTRVIGEHLINRRREFRQGERLIAQLTLSPPHEDMWVVCILSVSTTEESEGQAIFVPGEPLHQIGQIVPRESSRNNFWFELDETCPPGEYFLQLRSDGEELARRRFTLLPKQLTARP